jgi:hypothetical protein
LLAAAVLAAAAVADSTSAAEPAPTGLEVRVERTDGTAVSGTLAGVAKDAVRFVGQEPVPVAVVRRIVAIDSGARHDAEQGAVRVAGTDGGWVSGADFAWDGAATAVVLRPAGRIEMPIARVRSVTLRQPRGGDELEPRAWQAVLPDKPESDLVVVAAAADDGSEQLEVVECAIAAVAADVVTVVLDDERIPVKRAKVIGLFFLRNEGPAGGTRLEIEGGQLGAAAVAWTPEGLVVDVAVRMPAAVLRSIDYAAGRTVRLETLTAERTDAEPFFGMLGRLEDMAAYFAPRFLRDEAGSGLVVRPRTAVVWRVPADSRIFRTAVTAASGRQAAGSAVVTLLLDDREAVRQRIDAAADAPVELDVSGARRLAIKVDFGEGGGMGCAVRFADPVFEK